MDKNSLDKDVKGLSSFLLFFEGHKHNKKGHNHLIGESQLNKRYSQWLSTGSIVSTLSSTLQGWREVIKFKVQLLKENKANDERENIFWYFHKNLF